MINMWKKFQLSDSTLTPTLPSPLEGEAGFPLPRSIATGSGGGAQDSRGFTLLEVMISVGILAIVLVALLGLRNRAINLNGYARNLTIATLLAKEKVERFELEGPLQLGEISGDFEGEYSLFHWSQRVSSTPYNAVKEATIAVTWREGKKEETVEVTTYLVE